MPSAHPRPGLGLEVGWLARRSMGVRAGSKRRAREQGGSACPLRYRGHGHGQQGEERPNKEMARGFDCAGRARGAASGYSCLVAHRVVSVVAGRAISGLLQTGCGGADGRFAHTSAGARSLSLLSKPRRLLGLLLQHDSKVAGPPARHASAQQVGGPALRSCRLPGIDVPFVRDATRGLERAWR